MIEFVLLEQLCLVHWIQLELKALKSVVYHGPKQKDHKMTPEIVQQNSKPYHQNQASN